jgi:uncharacterized membrane protein YcgQ (UPF0703/DUF1980 family)
MKIKRLFINNVSALSVFFIGLFLFSSSGIASDLIKKVGNPAYNFLPWLGFIIFTIFIVVSRIRFLCKMLPVLAYRHDNAFIPFALAIFNLVFYLATVFSLNTENQNVDFQIHSVSCLYVGCLFAAFAQGTYLHPKPQTI